MFRIRDPYVIRPFGLNVLRLQLVYLSIRVFIHILTVDHSGHTPSMISDMAQWTGSNSSVLPKGVFHCKLDCNLSTYPYSIHSLCHNPLGFSLHLEPPTPFPYSTSIGLSRSLVVLNRKTRFSSPKVRLLKTLVYIHRLK